jgi:hypothetical protein
MRISIHGEKTLSFHVDPKYLRVSKAGVKGNEIGAGQSNSLECSHFAAWR